MYTVRQKEIYLNERRKVASRGERELAMYSATQSCAVFGIPHNMLMYLESDFAHSERR